VAEHDPLQKIPTSKPSDFGCGKGLKHPRSRPCTSHAWLCASTISPFRIQGNSLTNQGKLSPSQPSAYTIRGPWGPYFSRSLPRKPLPLHLLGHLGSLYLCSQSWNMASKHDAPKWRWTQPLLSPSRRP
jgi:hypothetical protein